MSSYAWIHVGSLMTLIVGNLGCSLVINPSFSEPTAEFQQVFNFFGKDIPDRGRGIPGGSRPIMTSEPICLVNPGDGEIIWHKEPMFLLRGNIPLIGIQPIDRSSQEPSWTAAIVEQGDNLFKLIYDGDTLDSGSTYNLLVYQGESEQVFLTLKIPFQIMEEGERRNLISAELSKLESDLNREGANENLLAQAKADYFLENDLPSDALQVLFSVEAPSASLSTAREILVRDICSKELL